MADPTLRLTFAELQKRVAEFLGIASYGVDGTEGASVPDHAQDIDKVKRIVNNAYRRLLTERDWNVLKVPFSVTFGTNTVDGDNSRYYAPPDFYGDVIGEFTFAPGKALPPLEYITEQELRDFQTAAQSSGHPVYYTFRPLNVDSTADGDRWEFIFWPTPSSTDTVTAIYRRYPNALSDDTDTSVLGFQHDATLLEACLAQAELEVGDDNGVHERAYQRELKKSIARDIRIAARRMGDYGDKSQDRQGGRRPKSYYRVDTYNGVSLE